DVDHASHTWREFLDDRAVAGLDTADDLRLIQRAAVGERRGRQRELQHRRARCALADCCEQRATAEVRALVAPRVPAARRHPAARLGVDADARFEAEAVVETDLGELVDVNALAQLVKIAITRTHDGIVQIDSPVYAGAAE